METIKLKTVEDLLLCPDERVELIGGEIVRRRMARSEHSLVQGGTRAELSTFTRTAGPGGWWILTEVSVAYEADQCPVHDLAGWRKERLPARPSGIIDLAPYWVCEIVFPGQERKDTLDIFLLLQRHRVPSHGRLPPRAHACRGARPAGPFRQAAALRRSRAPSRPWSASGATPAPGRRCHRDMCAPGSLCDRTGRSGSDPRR